MMKSKKIIAINILLLCWCIQSEDKACSLQLKKHLNFKLLKVVLIFMGSLFISTGSYKCSLTCETL